MPVIALRKPRPGRSEVEPAALELISRYGGQIMGTARRYSATPEDAEDAYQRGLEILLTKAPMHRRAGPASVAEDRGQARGVRPAQATRAARRAHRPEQLEPAAGHGSGTDEQFERMQRLQLGAEAMRRLKPQEVRCLLLLAEGYSYKQIQDITGWTYTKVNRCLSEGRRSFLQRVDRIESGAECERLAPNAVGAGRRRGQRRGHGRASAAPALVPLVPRFAARPPAGARARGGARAAWGSWRAEARRRARCSVGCRSGCCRSGCAPRTQLEMVTAHKAAAVAASAAVAGGGVAAVETIDSHERAPVEGAGGARA